MKYIIRRTDVGYQDDIVHYVNAAGGFGSSNPTQLKQWLEQQCPPLKDYTFICQSLRFMRSVMKRHKLLLSDCHYTIEPKINQIKWTYSIQKLFDLCIQIVKYNNLI